MALAYEIKETREFILKIYFAGPGDHILKRTKTLLFSYYDIYISSIPFRKVTWKIIKKLI